MNSTLPGVGMSYKGASHCVDALRIYEKYLHFYHRDGNEKFEEEILKIGRAIRHIENQTRVYLEQNSISEEGNDAEFYFFEQQELELLVATFPLLIRHYENEK